LGRVATGEDPQETKTNEIIEQTNTGLHYLETIYSNILKNKKSGLQTKQMINNYFNSILKKPMESLALQRLINPPLPLLDGLQSYDVKYKAPTLHVI